VFLCWSITTCIRLTFSLLSTPTNMKLNLWFPIRSMFVFHSAIISIEYPRLIPSVFFYSIAVVMFMIMYSHSKYPSPWKRCKVGLFLVWNVRICYKLTLSSTWFHVECQRYTENASIRSRDWSRQDRPV